MDAITRIHGVQHGLYYCGHLELGGFSGFQSSARQADSWPHLTLSLQLIK